MALPNRDPNTIHLGGDYTLDNVHKASGSIKPGSLIVPVNVSGEFRYKAHDSADAAAQCIIALEKSEWNLGVDDVYADGELVAAAHAHPGSTWWAYIPSGQNIVPGDDMQSNGDGGLKKLGSGTPVFTALEGTDGAITATRRLRVQRYN